MTLEELREIEERYGFRPTSNELVEESSIDLTDHKAISDWMEHARMDIWKLIGEAKNSIPGAWE